MNTYILGRFEISLPTTLSCNRNLSSAQINYTLGKILPVPGKACVDAAVVSQS